MRLWLPKAYLAETECEIKRSRFITTLARVDSEDEARDVISAVKKTYPDARHHCSAFIIDVPDAQPIERSSDDGEPSGTAGMPMLSVLRGADIGNTVAVVTRYFGGVLLGTGGLVRAYSDSVSMALEAAPRVRPIAVDLMRVDVSHGDYGRVRAELQSAGLRVHEVAFAAEVTMTLAVPQGVDAAAFVATATHGTGDLKPCGKAVLEDATK